jgi:hypothetical protein
MMRARLARLLLAAALCGAPLVVRAAEPATHEVGFAQLPAAAREALLAFHRREAAKPYACMGIGAKAFPAALGPLFRTDYNGDGEPDFIFRSPCRAPQDASPLGVRDAILLSGPYGYAPGERFAATLGVIRGQPALLVAAPCDDSQPTDLRPGCYLGRLLDPAADRWSEVQKISMRADGYGYAFSPYPPPPPLIAPPPPKPVASADLPALPKPPPATVAAVQLPRKAAEKPPAPPKPAKLASADILDRLGAELGSESPPKPARPKAAPAAAKPTLADLHKRAKELGVEPGH